MPTIYFVRHGQTDWNAEGRLQGQRDTSLNATGLRQAEEAADRLRALTGDALEGSDFVASPLIRTRRTMEALRACLNLPPEDYRTDPRLMEIGFGAWEGSTWAEIRRRDPAGAAARDRDRWGYQPPGAGGESYAMLAERVGPRGRGLPGSSVVVAHGGVARAMLVLLGGVSDPGGARIGSGRAGCSCSRTAAGAGPEPGGHSAAVQGKALYEGAPLPDRGAERVFILRTC